MDDDDVTPVRIGVLVAAIVLAAVVVAALPRPDGLEAGGVEENPAHGSSGASPTPEAVRDQDLGPFVEAQWIVVPDTELERDTRRVPLLIREVSCAGGRSAEGRIGDRVEYTGDEVIITVSVAQFAGIQRCPGNPLTPHTVELEEPLEGRALVNGATNEIALRPIVPPGTPTRYEKDGLLVGWPNGLDEELNALVVALHRVAQREDWPVDSLRLPVADEGLELLLGTSEERRRVRRKELLQRRSWGFDRSDEPYAGRSGELSVLDLLRGQDFLVVMDYVPCPAVEHPIPDGLEEFVRVRVMGPSTGSCRDLWWLDLYVDADREVRAIQLRYWRP